MFGWINGKNPRQYGFDFGLWTRQIVRDLIAKKFGVQLSLASVGALLARLGLTPQKPLQQAYQRDPVAVARWQRETYPAIVRLAKREKAEIYFWDESGFRADAVQGRTWGVRGVTPVVAVPGQRQGISAASAVNSKGGLLVRHLQRRVEWRSVRGAVASDDEGSPTTDPPGTRWPAGAQDLERAGLRRQHEGQADLAFPARVRAGLES